MLNDKLKRVYGKVEANGTYIILEERLRKTSLDLTASLKHNKELEENSNRTNNEIENTLRWTN